MVTRLNLNQLTVQDKLRIMEVIWEDLSRRADDVPVPEWHKDVLNERERLIKTGGAKFSDWEVAKKRISKRVS